MNTFNHKAEREKLERIVACLPEEKRELLEGLIADASFMAEQLEVLRDHIQENGWSETYQNGANQHGKKSSVEAEAYLKTQKLYAAVIRQLTDSLPKDADLMAGDELLDFIRGN